MKINKTVLTYDCPDDLIGLLHHASLGLILLIDWGVILTFRPLILLLLTYCSPDSLSHIIYWKSLISILGMSGYETYLFLEKKVAKLFANSGDPDQTPRYAASGLGLHCLPVTLLRVSRIQWVNDKL